MKFRGRCKYVIWCTVIVSSMADRFSNVYHSGFQPEPMFLSRPIFRSRRYANKTPFYARVRLLSPSAIAWNSTIIG